MDEVWREIPGWPMYEASSLGRIRRGSRVLQRKPGPRGYIQVRLRGEAGKRVCGVHQAVWAAFHGWVEDARKTHVHHINEDPRDNRLVNLETLSAGSHSRHHNNKHPRTKPCVVCETVFAPSPTKRERAQTCSVACLRDLQAKIQHELAGWQVIDGVDHKTCSACEEVLPVADFYAAAGRCKPCHIAASTARRRAKRAAQRPLPLL